ncbi:zinc finger protein 185 isoform X2 [Poeciliopsis prolifica]|uniref:zinc finger protein 185 isoform X2 n=1 Tax=Poeciliopsis prolifica TaxID=188132 RepID=UPI0024132553|nr:zinc finger protein 185 isoform X2 [Poeciliopsis prolifica]
MSSGDRASVLRTTKVRTKLRGDGSWLQRRDEPQAETQEEEKPWLAEVRARRLNGTPIETSPVSSPVNSTPPPVKSDTESKPATQGYLIRGVFTKLEKPVSTPSYNGTSTPKTFTKKPSETYKRIAPHIVRNTSENAEGQLSFEEQERRTEAALHVMKTKAVQKRSYVMSAAKLYETKDTPPDTSVATSSPSFVARRVEIFDDADSAVEPSPAVPPTSAASAPAPKPQTASSIDTIAALSDTLISLDTNPSKPQDTNTSSTENNKQELAEEEGGPVDSPTPEDSVEQEPDKAPRNGEPITGDLLGFSDGPEEPAEPVPSSPGRWSQDLLTGLGGLSVQQQQEEKQTDETAVETQSSDDPFDPNPIGTASHNSSPDLLEPSADVSINSSAIAEETRECSSPESIHAEPYFEYSCPNTLEPTKKRVFYEEIIVKTIPCEKEPENNAEEEEEVEEEEQLNVVEKQLHVYFFPEEKVEGEEENEEENVEEEEENEEEKVEEEEKYEEKVEEEQNEEEKVKEDEEEDQKVEEEEESMQEKEDEKKGEDDEKDEESSQDSWNYTWEIPHETSTVESQEATAEDKAENQQTVIMFERKSTENDSPWDKWTTPTVYTISTGTGDDDEEEAEEEERPAVGAEEQRVPTPELESKKPFVYVKQYVDATESLLNLRDPFQGSDDFAPSSSSYLYSSPSSYSRVSLSSTCTYCRKQVGNDAKISIEHLNINCHPECFKCEVCSRPMGDLLHSMFLHNKKVHCESCYATVI